MDSRIIDKIIDLNRKGLSLREISRVVGFSYESVRNVLRKYAGMVGTGKRKITIKK